MTSNDEYSVGEKIPTKELLAELRAAAEALGRPPSTGEMNEFGDFSAQTYRNRFGSWQDSLEAAGLDIDNPHRFAQKGLGGLTNEELETQMRSNGNQATIIESSSGYEVSCECGLEFTFQSAGDAEALINIHKQESGHSDIYYDGRGESTEEKERELVDRDIETLSLILPTVDRNTDEAISEFLSHPLAGDWELSKSQYFPGFIQRIEDARADVEPGDRWQKIRSKQPGSSTRNH